MQKTPSKPGVAAKTIASIFLLLELYWLKVTLPNPHAYSDNAFVYFYYYFFILLFVGPFFIHDGIRYLKTRYRLRSLDKFFFTLEIIALLAILFALMVTAGIINF